MSSEFVVPNQKRTNALDGRLTFEQARNRIIGRDDGGLARLLILANGSDFSMKVSQDGKDAITATDDELVFNSDNNLFKIVDTGILEFEFPAVGPGTSGQYTEAYSEEEHVHNLGEPPITIGFVDSLDIKNGNRAFFNADYVNTIPISNTASVTRIGRIVTTSESIFYQTSSILFGQTPSMNPYPAFESKMRWYIIRETAETPPI